MLHLRIEGFEQLRWRHTQRLGDLEQGGNADHCNAALNVTDGPATDMRVPRKSFLRQITLPPEAADVLSENFYRIIFSGHDPIVDEGGRTLYAPKPTLCSL